MAGTEARVLLHGHRVGTLSYAKGGTTFRYDDDPSLENHRTLGQIFEDDPHAVWRSRTKLPAWFANLLPEGELRRQVVREMGGGRICDYRLLLRLGSDLPGAVTVEGQESHDHEEIVAETSSPSNDDRNLRYSLAGVQLKYSVHSRRLTVRVSGPDGWWIVKLPDRRVPQLAENEYLTMRWLRAAGMDVPDVECLTGRAVPSLPVEFVGPDDLLYLVRRFDRTLGRRVHVEDFAQVSGIEPEFKYGEGGETYDGMARVIRLLLGEAAFRAFVARLVAMVVVGNIDAHLKNWALWYPNGRDPALAPVYDFHSLTVYSTYRYGRMALSLGGEQMPDHVGVENFRVLAEQCGGDPEDVAELVGQTVEGLRSAWKDVLAQDGRARFTALAEHYERRLTTLPISRG
jgi:serine/threonine-protein kinase HipA